MYLHIGNATVIRQDEIVGIFDLDTATISKKTRDYLNFSEKRKEVISSCTDLPKSFIVCSAKKYKNKVYLSQLSAQTLEKRF